MEMNACELSTLYVFNRFNKERYKSGKRRIKIEKLNKNEMKIDPIKIINK